MATSKIQTGVRFEEETLRKLTYIAKVNHRSLSGQLEYLAQKCIREFEESNQIIRLWDEDGP